MTTKAFVLGLDGVPWGMLRDWASKGELPNFGRLFEEGTTGPLESTNPATTPVAWPSIATGVSPDAHGLYSFNELTPGYRRSIHTSHDIEQPSLWNLMSPATVGNVPVTYPAQALDGELVAGMVSPRMNEQFTFPSSLVDLIRREIPDYQINLNWREYHGKPDELVADLNGLLDARHDLMEMLLDRTDWELTFFVYTEPDRLQHLAWGRDDLLLQHYSRIDEVLGDVLDRVERADANLFVVSDHGFGPVSVCVNVNTLLAEEGYLTPRTDTGTKSVLNRLGLDRSTVASLLKSRANVSMEDVVDRLPRSFVDSVAARLPGDHELYDVDYSETVAFLDAPGNVYVNDTERFEKGTVSPRRRPAVREEIIDLLTGLTDPNTGGPALDVVDGSELYARDERAPDVLVRGYGDQFVKATLADSVFTDPGVFDSTHRPEGIFLAWGPDIAAGATVEGASVVDVAPTVLHGSGEAVPDLMDGRVLDEVFAPDSAPGRSTVERYTYDAGDAPTPDRDGDGTDEDMDDVEDRLKGLGYME